jgi:hypothetical protein
VSWSRPFTPRRAALAGLFALAACGPLPQPYRGDPGGLARRLARPPAYRLAVPPPAAALLTDADAARFAEALAEALLAQEVPATSGEKLPLDWDVAVTTARQGSVVTPRFVLRDADGVVLGEHASRAVPARDWAEGDAETLGRVALEAAPALARLAARADAQRRTGDERAAGRGPPILYLRPVRGAPGDGNTSLTARMGERLAGFGFVVQDQAEGAEFAVHGVVSVVPTAPGLQRVEIVWTVSRRDGYDLGRVLQLNEVPAGSLNGLWADVAFVVAEEAAGGVRDVLANAGTEGAAGPPAPPPAAAMPAATAPRAPAGRAAPRPRR